MTSPLVGFLVDALPEGTDELGDHEMIVDAVVLYRVVDAEDGGERYRYTVTSGVSLGMAVGIIDLSRTTLMDYYTRCLAEEDEEDDGA